MMTTSDSSEQAPAPALTPAQIAAAGDYELFELGDVVLQRGRTLRGARLAYKTYGRLSAARDNAIVFSTWYSGTHVDLEWLIGPGRPLDTDRYFVIVPNLFGMGLSSSPSTTGLPHGAGYFPLVTVLDNVQAQHRLVTEVFGIETVECVLGGSMGALQAFQWGAAYPDMVKRILPFCGAASTSEHNQVFLEGLRGAIQLDPAWAGGSYDRNPEQGLRHFGRVYAGWGLSQQFYWQRAYLELGFSSLEDFLVGFWEGYMLSRDANDLLSQLETWYHADIGDTPGCGGDRALALGRITARALILPAETDLYFPPADNRWEAQQLPNAEVRVIPGIFGHYSCAGGFPEQAAFIGDCVRELLAG